MKASKGRLQRAIVLCRTIDALLLAHGLFSLSLRRPRRVECVRRGSRGLSVGLHLACERHHFNGVLAAADGEGTDGDSSRDGRRTRSRGSDDVVGH